MRIGILTYHYVFNEGAIWQAVSLCRCIREMFPQHDCEIVDYRHQGKYDSLCGHMPHDKQKLYEGTLVEYLGNIPIIDNHSGALFSHFSSAYDLVIVGSDIIWQFDRKQSLWRRICRGRERAGSLHPDRSTPYRFLRDIKNWIVHLLSIMTPADPREIPFPNAYWLDPESKYRKCTYAASVGHSDVKRIPSGMRVMMVRHLKALDLISVRDKASLRLVESLVPEKAECTRITPDPTWLAEESFLDVDDLFERYGISGSDKLAGVLFPSCRFYGERLNRWVLPMLRERGFKIISVIDSNSGTDFNLAGDIIHPFQWWGIISRLDFFFTIRMHPTIAALKSEIPFANIDTTAMFNRSSHSKSRDMLEHFGLQDCCLYRRSDFNLSRVCQLIEHGLERSWDWKAVARQRRAHQRAGLETLAAIIGETPND